ncbi:hypothetical protein BKP35_08770 [Anaerobacillus arseniciselenatis]|uniref:Uncharacterized protein n=1 Tax=Anaerobacillus arseniciselenatis TaxID=85682 RepID=A0A1S2LMV1_9BACI|nr:hypothetical protein [Anaerobacillus arseniciselenatis]OIJ13859.1 hypothetical protein BKP35_08770 [Anaerobacillus arseniciselenatis]
METYNQTAFPPLGLYNSDALNLKNPHDTYDVYVNEEHIGKKILLTQADEIEDVGDFLKAQGIENVSTNLNGDHYVIKTDEAQRVKNIIDAYLKNR